MAQYQIKCPLCPGLATIEIEDALAVFRVEGYTSNPDRRFSRLEPDPQAIIGGKTFVGQGEQRRIDIKCTGDHFLRIYVTHYQYLDKESCLYGPKETPQVQCIDCSYTFGTHEQFNQQISLSKENHMILRSLTNQPKRGHEEVEAISRRDCVNNDRISQRKDCPHCGAVNYFNYKSYAADPDIQFVGQGEA